MDTTVEETPNKVVFFDLDNTLFDHQHSLHLAISAIQKEYADLAVWDPNLLAFHYNKALQQVYNEYLDNSFTEEEADFRKVSLFCASVGLPKPTLEEVKEFRRLYKEVYRDSRRATPSAIETLARLRDNGYRIALITNGTTSAQTSKARDIGILHLTDRIITSEEAGCRKPDPRIFQYATQDIHAPSNTYMIGDSIDSDIMGALNAQLSPILYDPRAKYSQQLLSGRQIPVINHMSQVLQGLRIPGPHFDFRCYPCRRSYVIRGLGVDLVTEPRHCWNMSKEWVKQRAKTMGAILSFVSRKRYAAAIWLIQSLIQGIAIATPHIDKAKHQISRLPPGICDEFFEHPPCEILERKHSVRFEYTHLILDRDPESEDTLRQVANSFHRHCDELMRGDPEASIRHLYKAKSAIAEVAGTQNPNPT
ncbi:had-superfamily subfamily variant 1 [Fusarium austroafricanum]|uniref:Had-superfamily subfamily variant 1 n=1 Tax=Fusarium austroafricanum TaxID=2364996 RepID=A0A8H4NVC3_9HYPO|nr:had-superfamily subfamily variant 1 [Fusarium austroafricanum]